MLEYKPQEELIALIKRQEEELAAERGDSAKLRETLAGVQSRMGGLVKEKAEAAPSIPAGWIVRSKDDSVIVVQKHGLGGYAARHDDDNIASSILHAFASDLLEAAPCKPAETMDSDEFRNVLRNYGDTVYCSTQVIEYVDKYTARAVAAAVEKERVDYQVVADSHARNVRALDVALNGEAGAAKQASLCDILAQVKAEGIRSQSVAGELPPLPAAIDNAFMTLESTDGRYSIVMKFNQRDDAFDVHSYLVHAKAGQPVQQPAAE